MQFISPRVGTESATPPDHCGIDATHHLAFLTFPTAQPTSSLSKALQSKRTVASLPCSTKRSHASPHNLSLVAQTGPPTPVTQMTRPRPMDLARAIVESTVPGIKVEAITKLPSKRLLKSFRVKLVDGRNLLLTLSPPSPRLLRSEQWLLQSEATLLQWLIRDAPQLEERGTGYLDEKHLHGTSSPAAWSQSSDSDISSHLRDQLLTYLPTLLKHSPISIATDSTFNLSQPTPGDVLSSLEESLTPAEQASIGFQKGQLIRQIANITSPNGSFGIPVTVLGQPQTPGASRGPDRKHELDFDGADSWRKTFHVLLEGILRDGEDLAVMMSYELVRATFHKYGHLLDAVTTPRLVVYDAGEDDNVLVSRVDSSKGRKEQSRETNIQNTEKRTGSNDTCESPDEKDTPDIRITGLRDWSNCIFGDPLFATIFPHAPPEFEHGFYGSKFKPEDDDDMIEDPANASTRILLYECYHATVSIVRQFYQPDADSSRREIAARRRLVAALAKLENVPVSRTAGKRPRRESHEGPSKRPKPTVEENL